MPKIAGSKTPFVSTDTQTQKIRGSDDTKLKAPATVKAKSIPINEKAQLKGGAEFAQDRTAHSKIQENLLKEKYGAMQKPHSKETLLDKAFDKPFGNHMPADKAFQKGISHDKAFDKAFDKPFGKHMPADKAFQKGISHDKAFDKAFDKPFGKHMPADKAFDKAFDKEFSRETYSRLDNLQIKKHKP